VLAARDGPATSRRRHEQLPAPYLDGLREDLRAADDSLRVLHHDAGAVRVERGADDVPGRRAASRIGTSRRGRL